jgi:hypothetical protein
MAAPNIVNVSTIIGKTSVVTLSSTNATAIISNPSNSNKVFKINSLMVANIDGTINASVTINYYSLADIGGTATAIANTIVVPADASLVILDKNSSIYLEENKSLGAIASAANDLTIICSYEEIS